MGVAAATAGTGIPRPTNIARTVFIVASALRHLFVVDSVRRWPWVMESSQDRSGAMGANPGGTGERVPMAKWPNGQMAKWRNLKGT